MSAEEYALTTCEAIDLIPSERKTGRRKGRQIEKKERKRKVRGQGEERRKRKGGEGHRGGLSV